jgi:hypothetical protein
MGLYLGEAAQFRDGPLLSSGGDRSRAAGLAVAGALLTLVNGTAALYTRPFTDSVTRRGWL